MNITDMKIFDIVNNNTARFSHYRAGFVYYRIKIINMVYEFPIELSDVGNGTLNRDEKAITLMRWIRKAIDEKTMIKVD